MQRLDVKKKNHNNNSQTRVSALCGVSCIITTGPTFQNFCQREAVSYSRGACSRKKKLKKLKKIQHGPVSYALGGSQQWRGE